MRAHASLASALLAALLLAAGRADETPFAGSRSAAPVPPNRPRNWQELGSTDKGETPPCSASPRRDALACLNKLVDEGIAAPGHLSMVASLTAPQKSNNPKTSS
jgi:hypothetical protein